ncbi:Sporulation-specific protease YabG [Koleobacter methoxysyntrophicus]|uniref:Sporulation-specific protease YabG n=1 Tax=Koleobacter methoxysyntrophicus TaxID=2751313 RepID=A0A8A0RJN2_9FIRM|nr:sporulation peptidase YabG [Koleobacter methoxysyntrophicus]QSQ08535.1 Sporulation-specific protease YabG [Koleobacter methoxysyntrophicus]
MDIGDIVSRKSYNCDIFFKIVDIIQEGEQTKAVLKGLELRILADAPLDDLKKVSQQELREYKKDFIKKSNECLIRIMYRRKLEMEKRGHQKEEKNNNNGFFDKPGRVLHIDGDEEYLEVCLSTYKRLGMDVIGEHIPEKLQPKRVYMFLVEYSPDILVLTGHDGMLNRSKNFTEISCYRNSRYFVEAVKRARKYEPSLDELVIFAGACQSYYEELLRAGANFASSPHRVLIHCLDPVFITEKIAFSPIDNFVSIQDVIGSTITGIKGIGGFNTRGKLREGLPSSPYE